MSKRIGFDRSRFGQLRFLAHSQFQQSFLRPCGKCSMSNNVSSVAARTSFTIPRAKGHQFELAQIVEKADRGLC